MNLLPFYRAGAVVLCVMAMALSAVPAADAQWAGPNIKNILPMGMLEDFYGSLCPTDSMSNTFRSEFGLRFSAAEINKAMLTGSQAGPIDLCPSLEISDNSVYSLDSLLQKYLNGMPIRLDAYVTFRIWRLGLRGNYAQFKSPSNRPGRGYIDFSGLSAGADFDIVTGEWLKVGVCTDWYFTDPTFNGYVPTNTVNPGSGPFHYGVNPKDPTQPLGPYGPSVFSGPLPSSTYDFFSGTITGNKPATIGGYIRYIPPEILGFPVYFESALNSRIKGSNLASFGAALVFRPQIYRFDILARLKLQRLALTFEQDTASSVGLKPPYGYNAVPQTWQIEAAWNIYGVELGIYF